MYRRELKRSNIREIKSTCVVDSLANIQIGMKEGEKNVIKREKSRRG